MLGCRAHLRPCRACAWSVRIVFLLRSPNVSVWMASRSATRCWIGTLQHMPIGKEVAERRTRRVEPRGAATGASGLIKPLIVYALLSLIAAWRHLYASARLHERSCFFAQLSTNCFSSCSCLCLLDRIFKHQLSDLMFDGDCRRKFDFSSEPVCAHWALLWPSTPYRY